MRDDSENIVHWSGVENVMNQIDPIYVPKKKLFVIDLLLITITKKCYCY